jgi:putative FmdB family regulatory protein
MPVYEYECKNGHRFESIRRVTDIAETLVCQECKSENKIVRAKLVPSMTGSPHFRAGGAGGFYKPTRPEHDPSA